MRRDALDKRLRRLQGAFGPPHEVVARQARRKARWTVEACEAIRETALAAGIDPETVVCLGHHNAAIFTLRAARDTPELAAADEAMREADARWDEREPSEPDRHDEVIAWFDAKVEEYRKGGKPEPDGPLLCWLAWASALQDRDAGKDAAAVADKQVLLNE